MSYQQFPPRPELRAFVQCVWAFEAPAGNREPQRIAPDGRPELIFQLGAPYAERDDLGERLQPAILFAGQLTEPLTLVATGPVSVIAVRFRPDGARAFLHRDASFATDERVDLTSWKSAEDVLAELRAAPDAETRADLALDFVAARIGAAAPDPVVRGMVTRLLVNEEVEEDSVSERQAQRRFKSEVGISPRMLATILRFRRVFDAIEHPEKPGWVEAALKAGYFDQPQMARDFRRFLGCTARQWATSRADLAKALAAPETYKN